MPPVGTSAVAQSVLSSAASLTIPPAPNPIGLGHSVGTKLGPVLEFCPAGDGPIQVSPPRPLIEDEDGDLADAFIVVSPLRVPAAVLPSNEMDRGSTVVLFVFSVLLAHI